MTTDGRWFRRLVMAFAVLMSIWALGATLWMARIQAHVAAIEADRFTAAEAQIEANKVILAIEESRALAQSQWEEVMQRLDEILRRLEAQAAEEGSQ